MKPASLFLIWFYVLVVNTASAQELIFMGKVSDTKGEPVLGATALLLQPADSTYISGSVSDQKGFFSLKSLKEGTYILKISYVGYKTLFSSIHIPANSGKSNEFTLDEEANKLNEVIVKGSRPVTEMQGNQINFNINDLLAKASINAYALLNKAPGIVVTADERIMLLGQTNILVKLDGKRAFSDVDDAVRFLKSTPAANIDRIEIQYAAGVENEGTYASVINIITKKDLKNGIKGVGSLGFNQGNVARYLAAINTSYVHDNFSAYVISSYSHFAVFEQRDRTQKLSNYARIYEISDKSDTNTTPDIEGIRLGASYNLNKRSSLNLVVGYTYANRKQFSDYATVFKKISADSMVNTSEKSFTTNGKFYTNLNYELRKEKTKVTLEASALNDNSNIMSSYDNIIKDGLLFKLNGNRLYKVTTVSTILNISKNFEHGLSIDAGGKFAYTRLNDDIAYSRTGELLLDDILGSNSPVRYNEIIGAGYFNAAKPFGKVNLNAGIRYEIAKLNGILEKNKSEYSRTFPNILPTISANFPINAQNKISLLYKQYLVRPNYSQLNPSTLYINPYTVLQGNLAIAQYNSYSFTATYSLLNKYLLTAKYSYSDNAVPQYILSRVNEQLTRITYDNAISGGGIQTTLYIPITVAKRWSSYNNINAFRLKYITTNDIYKGFDFVNYNFNASSSNVISLNKDYSVSVDLSYSSGLRVNQSTTRPIYGLDFQISKSWFQQNLNVSLQIQDILYSSIRRGYAYYNSTVSNFYETADTRRVGINVRYNFGNSKLVSPRQRGSGLEEEESRAKYNVPVK